VVGWRWCWRRWWWACVASCPGAEVGVGDVACARVPAVPAGASPEMERSRPAAVWGSARRGTSAALPCGCLAPWPLGTLAALPFSGAGSPSSQPFEASPLRLVALLRPQRLWPRRPSASSGAVAVGNLGSVALQRRRISFFPASRSLPVAVGCPVAPAMSLAPEAVSEFRRRGRLEPWQRCPSAAPDLLLPSLSKPPRCGWLPCRARNVSGPGGRQRVQAPWPFGTLAALPFSGAGSPSSKPLEASPLRLVALSRPQRLWPRRPSARKRASGGQDGATLRRQGNQYGALSTREP
jgi:hypothetical protein